MANEACISMKNRQTVKGALLEGVDMLESAGIEEAGLEARLLLCHVLGINTNELQMQLNSSVLRTSDRGYKRLIERRSNHEPVAYITGRKEFFGLEFNVTPDTLIPRPETELLVVKSIEIISQRHDSVALICDVGTGCGAIAIALAKEFPFLEIMATDISSRTLRVAHQNALHHGVADRVHFVQADLIPPVDHKFDIILGNLPYVARGEIDGLSEDIRMHEPLLALDGGQAGLDHIDRTISLAYQRLSPDGALLLEIDPFQRDSVISRAMEVFGSAYIEVSRDISGRDRVILVEKSRWRERGESNHHEHRRVPANGFEVRDPDRRAFAPSFRF